MKLSLLESEALSTLDSHFVSLGNNQTNTDKTSAVILKNEERMSWGSRFSERSVLGSQPSILISSAQKKRPTEVERFKKLSS